MFKIKYSGIEKDLIKDLFVLSNNYKFVHENFITIHKQFNLLEQSLKLYRKESFIKAMMLFFASLKLLGSTKELPLSLPNESNIIIRSLAEHFINFDYITNHEYEIQIKKIERYNDHSKLAAEEFKSKYNANKDYNWAGKSIYERLKVDAINVDEMEIIHQIYKSCCKYTHVSSLSYLDGNILTNKPKDKDIIESLLMLNLVFIYFIKYFYAIHGLKMDFIKKNYIDKFGDLDKYAIEVSQ